MKQNQTPRPTVICRKGLGWGVEINLKHLYFLHFLLQHHFRNMKICSPQGRNDAKDAGWTLESWIISKAKVCCWMRLSLNLILVVYSLTFINSIRNKNSSTQMLQMILQTQQAHKYVITQHAHESFYSRHHVMYLWL